MVYCCDLLLWFIVVIYCCDCVVFRLLAVAGFDTHTMANFSTPLRFEYFSYAPSILATKLPGIRLEFTANSKSKVDKKKQQVCV